MGGPVLPVGGIMVALGLPESGLLLLEVLLLLLQGSLSILFNKCLLV